MTKSEILVALATKSNLKKKEVETVMKSLEELILATLKKEGKIKLDGLGVFQLKDRPARMARNPATGEMVKVAAKRVVKFRVVKSLKEAVLKK